MRKLLRCKRTKAFLTRGNRWTLDIRKALNLSDHEVPEGIRDYFRPNELEIYYSFDDSRESQWDFTLSVYY